MSVRTNTEGLRQIPLFAECDPAHLQVLAFASERVEIAAGNDIFRAGSSGASAYLLLAGDAEVWRTNGGQRITIANAGPGAFLGELAMIAGAPYTVTATATRTVTATRIGRDIFLRVVDEFPDFGTKVMNTLSRKLTGSVGEFDRIRKMLENARTFPRR